VTFLDEPTTFRQLGGAGWHDTPAICAADTRRFREAHAQVTVEAEKSPDRRVRE
jgi:hypothetical protein